MKKLILAAGVVCATVMAVSAEETRRDWNKDMEAQFGNMQTSNGEFDTSIPVFEKGGGNVPEPKAAVVEGVSAGEAACVAEASRPFHDPSGKIVEVASLSIAQAARLCKGASDTSPAECREFAYIHTGLSKEEEVGLCTGAKSNKPVYCYVDDVVYPASREESLRYCSGIDENIANGGWTFPNYHYTGTKAAPR